MPVRPKVVLLGDSITEWAFQEGGWGAALAHHFARKVDVVLRGYSGYNTRWALKVLDRAVAGIGSSATGGGEQQQQPVVAAATVFFGANDAALPDRYCWFQNVPIPEYTANLKSIVSSLKEKWPAAVIVLITPPPIDEDGRVSFPLPFSDGSGLPERTNDSAGAYAKACVAVAEESGVPVIDLWTRMQQVPGWEKALLSDGLHLTKQGNKVLFEEVLNAFNIHGVSLEGIPNDLPIFDDIDRDEPIKSLEGF